MPHPTPGAQRAFEISLPPVTSAGLLSSLSPARGWGFKGQCGLRPGESQAPGGRKGKKLKSFPGFFQEEPTPDGADGTSCDVSPDHIL